MKKSKANHIHNLIVSVLLIYFASVTASAVVIPSGPDAVTQKAYNLKYLDWLRRVTVTSYQQSSPDPDSSLADFLTQAIQVEAQAVDALPINTVILKGSDLMMSGNRSPWLLAWYGILLNRAGKNSDAVPVLREALAGFETDGNSKAQAMLISGFFAQALYAGSTSQHDECTIAIQKHIDFMTQVLADGVFSGSDIQIAYRLISERFQNPLKKVRWERYFEKFSGSASIDPWLLSIVEGRVEDRQAWNKRGYGYSNTVTEEGWKGFDEHGRSAYEVLKSAHDLHPEFPEAAALLVSVANSGQAPDDEPTAYWFEKSVNAQMDYEQTYKNYVWSLRPRWGGSHEAMRSFAEECLKTGRYDTIVPYVYFTTLRDIADEAPIDSWFCSFRDSDTINRLTEMFKTYRKSDSWNADWKIKFAAQELVFKTWAGKYQEAAQSLTVIDDDFDMRNGIYEQSFTWNNATLKELKAEIRAMTGPEGKAIGEIRAKHCSLADMISNSCKTPYAEPSQKAVDVPREMELLLAQYNDELTRLKDDLDARSWLATCIVGIKQGKEYKGIFTPLQIAIRDSTPDVVRFLLENGVNPNDCGTQNLPPLRFALDQGKMDIIRILLDFGASTVINEDETLLHHAVRAQNMELIGLLLKDGADINAVDSIGRTPIHDAVINNRMMLCRFLIESGASVNTISGNHESLLQIALHYKAYDVVRLILEQDVNVNVVDKAGYSPIYFALDSGELDIIRKIIEKNLDLTVPAPDGFPLLLSVIMYDYDDILQLLLEKGIDFQQKYKGKTALDCAEHYKKQKTLKVLKKWKR